MIYTRPRYDRAWRKLTPSQQAAVNAAVARLEAAFGKPHEHSGLGLRAFGRYYEFRAGLGFPTKRDGKSCDASSRQRRSRRRWPSVIKGRWSGSKYSTPWKLLIGGIVLTEAQTSAVANVEYSKQCRRLR